MSKRHAIIELHRARVSNSMIIKQLKVPKSTVYNTVARFKELGGDKDRPRSGRPCTALTPKIIKAARERVGRKMSLKKAWAKIPQEKLLVSVESFRGRLKRVKAKGRHIEI